MTDPTNPFQNRGEIMRHAEYTRGFNDALEAVAKWHKEMAAAHSAAASVFVEHSAGHKIAMEAAVTHDKSAAHVRSLKKP